MIISYLNHAYKNILPEFESWKSLFPLSSAQNVETPDFDIWPDLDLTCEFNLRFT